MIRLPQRHGFGTDSVASWVHFMVPDTMKPIMTMGKENTRNGCFQPVKDGGRNRD